MKKIKSLLMCFVLLCSLGMFGKAAHSAVITDNLTWTWNAFVHPANIPFVYEYSLNGGAWTETTETSFTATGLSEGGNQSFRVRIKLLTTPTQIISPDNENADSFGIDNTPPTMVTLTLNDGSPATDSTTVNFTANAHDIPSAGVGSGIAYYEVSIDQSDYNPYYTETFTPVSGSEVTLPTAEYDYHSIAVRAVDYAGHASNYIIGQIELARHVSAISGTSTDALQATLKNLYGFFSKTVDVEDGSFQFKGIPDGVYGLVLTNNQTMKAYEKRISVHDGMAIDLGEITIGTEAGTISGKLTTDNIPVVAGIDLGQGFFLAVNETVTSSGSFTISSLAPGNYTLKAVPASSTSYFSASVDVTVTTDQTTTQNLSLIPGNRVIGTFPALSNWFMAHSAGKPRFMMQAISSAGKFETAVQEYAPMSWGWGMVLPSGDYQFIVKSENYSMEPQFVTINAGDNYLSFKGSVSNSLLSGTLANTGTVLSAEAGINKALQVWSGFAETTFMTSFSGEYGSSQTTWYSYIADSMTAENALYLIADDMAKGIHSLSQVDANFDSGNITVNSAGGSLSGVVTLNGVPVIKPRIIILNSTNTVVGTCQGSSTGEYFFKHLKAGAVYGMRVTDTENNISKDFTPAITADQDTVLNVELAEKTLSITEYETEVTDGVFNATVELTNLEAGSSYKVYAVLYSSDWVTKMSQKWITVTNGTFNVEMSVDGLSGTNCNLKVFLYKGSNTTPEAREIKSGINLTYIAKTLSIPTFETEVTDGVFNATLALANLETGSIYKAYSVLYSSNGTAKLAQKWQTVTNGTVNLEMSVAGLTESNCTLKVYLYKGSNTTPEARESKSGINIVAKILTVAAFESEVTDGTFNATLALANLEAGSIYKAYAVLYASNGTTKLAQKWQTVTNGTSNLEMDVIGLTGSNCSLKVYLYKGSNTTPETRESKSGINIVYVAKTLSITACETEVTDGIFNATLALANLEIGSTYKAYAVLYTSNGTTKLAQKWQTVTNGTSNLEMSVAGLTGSNCSLKVYLYKGSNTTPESKEMKSGINIR